MDPLPELKVVQKGGQHWMETQYVPGAGIERHRVHSIAKDFVGPWAVKSRSLAWKNYKSMRELDSIKVKLGISP